MREQMLLWRMDLCISKRNLLLFLQKKRHAFITMTVSCTVNFVIDNLLISVPTAAATVVHKIITESKRMSSTESNPIYAEILQHCGLKSV